ncbi:MAG: diaminopimelate epimerase [Capsulimonadales bacterium]|nr:diaminopimelate epimerase [Capsulimonadales bacterium]
MTLDFTKMHGLGNDFVVVDGLAPGSPSVESLIPHLPLIGDRRFGVGFDQFLVVLPSEAADFTMRIFNPDGSEAEMCGNGIRAFAKFVYDRGYTSKSEISVSTLGGVKYLALETEAGKVTRVRVDMGEPGLQRSDLPMTGESGPVTDEPLYVQGEVVRITGVSMGNPHVVFFSDNATEELINRLGPLLENHEHFPRRTNVHLVQVVSSEEIRVLTWERGAGRTLACGTGACASVVASHVNGRIGRRATVHLLGGDLLIDWAADNHVYMTGPATEVFSARMEW